MVDTVLLLPSVMALETLSPPADLSAVRVLGFAEAGDGGEASWRKLGPSDTPLPGGTVEDADGNVWEIVDTIINIRSLGARGEDNVDDTAALRRVALTGRSAYIPPAIFRFTDTIELEPGVTWAGDFTGLWPMANAGGYPKNMDGPILLLVKTPTSTYQMPFVSNMDVSGGKRFNPSHLNTNDEYYILTDYTLADANEVTGEGASLKPFTVAIRMKPGANTELRNLRVMLSFDETTALWPFVQAYNQTTRTYLAPNPPENLGTVSCDHGILIDNNATAKLNNCQVVGYWRMAGIGVSTVITNDTNALLYNRQGAEYCSVTDCNVQGQVGVLIRGADQYKVLAVGTDYIEIPWTKSHTFRMDTTLGKIRVTTGAPAVLNYTGQQKVGDRLRLTGVTNANGTTPPALPVGSNVSPSLATRGITNFTIRRGEFGSMWHGSRKRTTDLSGVTLRPSTSIEVSGRALRGMLLQDVKCSGYDDVALHLHDVIDFIVGEGTSFENVTTDVSPGVKSLYGMRVLASNGLPSDDVPYTAGNTDQFVWNAVFPMTMADLRPTYPVFPGFSAPPRFSAPGDDGLFTPGTTLGFRLMEPFAGGFGGPVGASRGFVDSTNNFTLYIDGRSENLIFRQKSTTTPGTYNVALRVQPNVTLAGQDIIPASGVSPRIGQDGGHAFSQGVFNQVMLGSGGPTIMSGTVPPEGAVSARPGSLYTVASDGAAAVWQKQSGTGSAGWVRLLSPSDLNGSGTFIPTIAPSSPGGAGDYQPNYDPSGTFGYYSWTGKTVTVSIDILFSPVFNANVSGFWMVGTLPFAAAHGNYLRGTFGHSSALFYATGRTEARFVAANTTALRLRAVGSGAADQDIAVGPGGIASGSNVWINIALTYAMA